MANPTDLYGLLGVSKTATADDIRKAYRKLARQHHPDVNPNDPRAEERFKEISFAYDALSDPEKRRRYDEFGMAGLQPGFDPEQARAWQRWSRGARRSPFRESMRADIDLEDLLAGLGGFGHRGGAWRDVPLRGRDAESEVVVEFLDAALAREVRVELAGRGALRVQIPRGATDGTRVRLAGQGEPGVGGGPPGDLYLTLRVRPHPLFTRSGDDLHLDCPVTLPELIRGASIEVPTPDGPVTVKVPARARAGQRLRLRGKGAARRSSPRRGDLYVRLVPELPEGDDPRLDEIADRLDPLYAGRDVRARLRSAR
jgi:curved DNA-binding protein